MSLRDQLTADMKDAMKSGDKRKLATIRLMNAAIKDKDINSRTEGHDSEKISDAAILDEELRPLATTKAPTTRPVDAGIGRAISEVLASSKK